MVPEHDQHWRSGGSAFDIGDCIADCLEVLCLFIGNADAELLFGGIDDLDHRQRVHVKIVGERLVQLDVVGWYAGDLIDDLGEICADFLVVGISMLLQWCWDCSSVQISGQDDHLTGVDQAGAEADDQTGLPLVSLA